VIGISGRARLDAEPRSSRSSVLTGFGLPRRNAARRKLPGFGDERHT
jgi:hypothetical protein